MQHENGQTLKIIASGCTRGELNREAWCRSLVLHIAQLIRMHPISGPHSVRLVDLFGDTSKEGVSVVLIIAESHIACHTWTSYSAARIIIDSCADFDADMVVEEVNRILRPEEINHWSIF